MNQSPLSIYPVFVRGLVKNRAHGLEGLLHAAVGMSGESGEVLDLIKKKWVSNRPLDTDKLKHEAGDVLFYLQQLCNLLGVTLEEIAALNIKKLSARYPNGYSDEASAARADEAQSVLPTLEQIEQVAQALLTRKELNWAGFRQDAQGKYTIPVISESQYKLVLGAIKSFLQPVKPSVSDADFKESVGLMLAAVGYTEEYARQWPDEKVSVTFKRWFDEQIEAVKHTKAPNE